MPAYEVETRPDAHADPAPNAERLSTADPPPSAERLSTAAVERVRGEDAEDDAHADLSRA